MTNLYNKFERTEDQILFEKEIGKWLKKTRLSKTKVNPLTGRTMVVTQTKLAKHLGVSFQQIQSMRVVLMVWAYLSSDNVAYFLTLILEMYWKLLMLKCGIKNNTQL